MTNEKEIEREKIYQLLWLLSGVPTLKQGDNYSYHYREKIKIIDFPHFFNDVFQRMIQLDVYRNIHISEVKYIVERLRLHPFMKYPQGDSLDCKLDILPNVVRDRIFSYCSGFDLINFCHIYPQYTEEIMHPSLWKKYLRFHLDKFLFSIDELKRLLCHMKGYIGYFSFLEWNDFDQDFYKEFIKENAKSIEALFYKDKPNEIFEHIDICHRLKHLIIESSQKVIKQDLLEKLCKSGCKLETLRLNNTNIINDAFRSFFVNANVENLKNLDLNDNDIRDSTLEIIAKR